jgi:hypothetical protein
MKFGTGTEDAALGSLQAVHTEREARRWTVYDAIVIGTRVAGATTAMLLARKGLTVLAVDRASFPSDTLSTNNIQLPGVARLERWGLLGQVAAAGTPAIRRVRFDPGPVVLEGGFPSFDGLDAVYGPRRTLLDALLVEAAREAGAEVRERFVVDELAFSDGRVTGIRGRTHGGGELAEQAGWSSARTASTRSSPRASKRRRTRSSRRSPSATTPTGKGCRSTAARSTDAAGG